MLLSDLVSGVKSFFSGKPCTSAVILAAGNGSRMGGGKTPKQLRLLLGIPVAVRSLLAFEACEDISETVLVTRESDIAEFCRLKEIYHLKKLSAIVSGGETRAASAAAGLAAITKKATHVAFHDAARCLVTSDIIHDVVKAAYLYHAATAASPIYDTVKRVTREGFIEETLPREALYAAETPQIFSVPLYRAALSYATREALSVTDDNQMVEAVGHAVKVVPHTGANFKITTAEDLYRAEAVLAGRETK